MNILKRTAHVEHTQLKHFIYNRANGYFTLLKRLWLCVGIKFRITCLYISLRIYYKLKDA